MQAFKVIELELFTDVKAMARTKELLLCLNELMLAYISEKDINKTCYQIIDNSKRV